MGLSKKPVSVFKCDYKGIEPELEAYKELKKINLERTDDFLASFATLNQAEFAIQLTYEILKATGMTYHKDYIRRLIQEATRERIADLGEEESGIFKGARDLIYKNQDVIDSIKKEIKQKLNISDNKIPQKSDITNISNIPTTNTLQHPMSSIKSITQEIAPHHKETIQHA
jgi:sugar-specific transcriptional regulator TrmB